MPPPVDSMDGRWTETEKTALEGNLGRTAVGSPDTVSRAISAFMAETRADEIIMISQIYEHAARVHSYEIVADVHARLTEAEQRAIAS
jgi:alkanesulfonate monooxygenase SsuD/methylene tetrahydromethanopterin reductase-like flavin-dependent oxidoreductase (luciferase family)